MNVHFLIVENDGNKSVEAFTSRDKMVVFKNSLDDCSCTMFPPIAIGRSIAGIMQVITIVNKIHTKGETQVLEELEAAMEGIEDINGND